MGNSWFDDDSISDSAFDLQNEQFTDSDFEDEDVGFDADPFGSQEGFGDDPFGADPFGNEQGVDDSFSANSFNVDPFGGTNYSEESYEEEPYEEEPYEEEPYDNGYTDDGSFSGDFDSMDDFNYVDTDESFSPSFDEPDPFEQPQPPKQRQRKPSKAAPQSTSSNDELFSEADGGADNTETKSIGIKGTVFLIAGALVLVALILLLLDSIKVDKKEDVVNQEQQESQVPTSQDELVQQQQGQTPQQEEGSEPQVQEQGQEEHEPQVVGSTEDSTEPTQVDPATKNDPGMEPAENKPAPPQQEAVAPDIVELKVVPNDTEVDYTREAKTVEGSVIGKERYLRDGQLLYNIMVQAQGFDKTLNYYCGYDVFSAVTIGDSVSLTYQQVSDTVISISGIAK